MSSPSSLLRTLSSPRAQCLASLPSSSLPPYQCMSPMASPVASPMDSPELFLLSSIDSPPGFQQYRPSAWQQNLNNASGHPLPQVTSPQDILRALPRRTCLVAQHGSSRPERQPIYKPVFSGINLPIYSRSLMYQACTIHLPIQPCYWGDSRKQRVGRRAPCEVNRDPCFVLDNRCWINLRHGDHRPGGCGGS